MVAGPHVPEADILTMKLNLLNMKLNIINMKLN